MDKKIDKFLIRWSYPKQIHPEVKEGIKSLLSELCKEVIGEDEEEDYTVFDGPNVDIEARNRVKRLQRERLERIME